MELTFTRVSSDKEKSFAISISRKFRKKNTKISRKKYCENFAKNNVKMRRQKPKKIAIEIEFSSSNIY